MTLPGGTLGNCEGIDWHWGSHPAHGFATKHVGPREQCSGPDCGPDPDDAPESTPRV